MPKSPVTGSIPLLPAIFARHMRHPWISGIAAAPGTEWHTNPRPPRAVFSPIVPPWFNGGPGMSRGALPLDVRKPQSNSLVIQHPPVKGMHTLVGASRETRPQLWRTHPGGIRLIEGKGTTPSATRRLNAGVQRAVLSHDSSGTNAFIHERG